MALLIDGYNLLHVTEIFGTPGEGTDLHRSRLALLDFLAASIDQRKQKQSTVVFDAAGAPPGLPRTLTHGGLTVQFARRHSNADELIEELLEQYTTPRELLVVSSDHRVQRAARRHGADFVDSEEWYAELRAAQQSQASAGENLPCKTDSDMSQDEVAYWVDEFAGAPPDDTTANPFPPGYADDLQEAEE